MSARRTLPLLAALTVGPLQAATVFDYRFETGPAGAPVGTVFDSGPNALHGTATGLAYTGDTAPGGGSFALDARGDFNFALIPHAQSMVLQTFSLSLKARPDAACTGPQDLCFIAIKKTLDSGSFLASYSLFYTEAGRFGAELGYGGGQGLQITSADTFAIGSGWHDVQLNLARDVDGAIDEVSLYVDGQLQAQHRAALPALAFTTSGFYLGAGNFLGRADSEYRRNFNGAIDNVRLSDVPLPPVPEPGTWALFAAGLLAVGRVVRRRG